MPIRLLTGLLIVVLFFCYLLPVPAAAVELPRVSGIRCRNCGPGLQRAPRQYLAPPTRAHGFSVYNVSGPYYGRGFGVPKFNWGYFGARHRTAVECHKGHYETFTQWGFSRGH